MFHGTQCVPLQIMKQFTFRQALPLLSKDTLKDATPQCIQLFNNLTCQQRLKQAERVTPQVVTLGRHYSKTLTGEEMLAIREKVTITSDIVVKVFNRVVVNGQLYYSQEFTRVEKRNSFTLQLQNDNIITVYSYMIV